MAALSLQDAFKEVTDPHSHQGRRYPLHAVLNLLALGALLGRPSLSGAARLVGQYGRELAILLGFRHYTVPSVATLSVLLRRLDPEQVEAAIRRWVAARMAEHGIHRHAQY